MLNNIYDYKYNMSTGVGDNSYTLSSTLGK